MKLRYKISIVMSMIVLISLSILAVSFYVMEEQSLHHRLEAQMTGVSMHKYKSLMSFISEEQEDVDHIMGEMETLGLCSDIQSQRTRLVEEMERTGDDFSEFFVMDDRGKVELSTDLRQEGKILAERPFFKRVDSYVSPFYYSNALGEGTMVFVQSACNDTVFFAGRVNPDTISSWVTEVAGLGSTGESYLVSADRYALTALMKSNTSKFVFSEGVDQCLAGKQTHPVYLHKYEDYVRDEVIGTYIWLPEYGACLLTEIDVAEAMQPLRNLQRNTFGLTGMVLMFAVLIGYLLSDHITGQISVLREMAEDIAQGRLDVRTDIRSDDEIGSLSRSFDHMARKLQASNRKVKEQKSQLHSQVEERTLALRMKIEQLEQTKKAMLNILEDADISNKELKKTKVELKRKVVQLQEMDKKKDEFLSITAHELKTPLTSIKGFSELLKDEKVMDKKELRDKYFNIIIEDTARLSQLVTDILDLSRLDLGTMKFQEEEVSMGQIFEELRDLVELAIKNKGLQLIFAYDDVSFSVDKSRLLQVLTNIINNAIKYTEQGHIRVEAHVKDEVIFFVQDTGKGISRKDIGKIFDRFYQSDSSYTRKVGGTGLGLSIAKAIVEHMGGNISVKSSKGKGSKFIITIPFRKI